MTQKSTLILFLDDEPTPIAQLASPVTFELDTTRPSEAWMKEIDPATLPSVKNSHGSGHESTNQTVLFEGVMDANFFACISLLSSVQMALFRREDEGR